MDKELKDQLERQHNFSKPEGEKGSGVKRTPVKIDARDLEIISVNKAISNILNGSNEVKLANGDEAIDLYLKLFVKKGYRDTTQFTPKGLKENKMIFPEQKKGTYHWDLKDTEHNGPHLQIHTRENDFSIGENRKARIIRIFFEPYRLVDDTPIYFKRYDYTPREKEMLKDLEFFTDSEN